MVDNKLVLLAVSLIFLSVFIGALNQEETSLWKSFTQKISGEQTHEEIIYFPSLDGEEGEYAETVARFGTYDPEFTSVADAPDPVNYGADVTFTTVALDSIDEEALRLHVCKTSAVPSDPQSADTCGGGTWCSIIQGSYSVNPSCAYDTTGESEGAKSYWAFIYDSSGAAAADNSRTGSFTVDPPLIPYPPTYLRADYNTAYALNSGSGEVNLIWVDNSGNETGFKVQRSMDGSSYSDVTTTGASVESYDDTSVNDNNTYYYRIKATNANGDSAPSNVESLVIPDRTKPNTPSLTVSHTGTNNYINTSWSDPGDVSSEWMQANIIADSNLVGYWPLDEGSGSTSEDIGGNTNNSAALNTGATWVTSSITGSNAILFDGTGSTPVVVDDRAEIGFTILDAFTVSVWFINSDNLAEGEGIVGDDPLSSAGSFALTHGYWNSLRCYMETSTTLYSTSGSGFGGNKIGCNVWQWCQMTCVYDGATDTLKSYVNGNLLQTAATSGVPRASINDIVFGNDGALNGYLDEVKIYNVALSEDELRAIFLRDSLIGYWRFDNGTNAYDSSPNANKGTVTGATSTTGKIGNALDFSGSSQSVSMGDKDLFTILGIGGNDNDFTVSAWINMDDATSFRIIEKFGTTDAQREWAFAVSSADLLTLTVRDSGGDNLTVRYGTALTAYEGEWIHVAGSYNGEADVTSDKGIAGIELYLNGVSVEDVNASSGTYDGMSNTTEPLTIGLGSGNYADGKIDEVMLFNVDLNKSDIVQLYEQGRRKFELRRSTASEGPYSLIANPVQSKAGSVESNADYYDLDDFEGGASSSDEWVLRNSVDPDITNSTAYTGSYSLHMPSGYGKNFEGAGNLETGQTSAGYNTNDYPYMCMAYKIPAATVNNMLILVNGTWKSITMTQTDTPTQYAKVASWNPIADDAWHYKCINLDEGMDATLGTGVHTVTGIIWYKGQNTPTITGEFWIDDFVISRNPWLVTTSYQDNAATDAANPPQITGESAGNPTTSSCVVSWTEATDAGTTYYYDLNVFDYSGNSNAIASTQSDTVTTGISDYEVYNNTDAGSEGWFTKAQANSCSGGTCSVTISSLSESTAYSFKVRARDGATNTGTYSANATGCTTTASDSDPPTQSSHSPAKSATITTTGPTITFTTNENADCKWSLTDQAYGDMSNDCTGDGGTSQTCVTSGLSEGAEIVYVACSDEVPNEDSIATNEHIDYTVDTAVPTQSSWSPAKSATTNTAPTITFTTNENADCKWSLTDQAYGDMSNDCTGDGGTSQTCVTSGLSAGSEIVYTACQDTPGNEDSIATNEHIDYTVDDAVPTQSSHSPAKSATITTTGPTITFTTNENADCKWSLTDQAYGDMSNDCTGDGGTSQTCVTSGLSEGSEIVYAACRDTVLNADSVATNEHIDYTVDTSVPTQSSWAYAKSATITVSAFDLNFTTNENADCKWSLTDQAYGDMSNDCTGDGGTSQTCPVTGLQEGSEIVYAACRDTALNADSISTNEHIDYTVDTVLPTQSSWAYAKNATITTTAFDLNFTTNENADCKWSLTDQAYGDMAGDCTGDGGTSQTCATSGLSQGYEYVYAACQDTATNQDTSGTNEDINYLVDSIGPTGTTISFGTLTTTSIAAVVSNASDATTGLHATPYYFDETTGPSNSGWQSGTTWNKTGLDVNTMYSFKVRSRDVADNNSSYTSTQSKFTLANAPGQATVNGATTSTLDVTIAVNSNPAGTQFAIDCTGANCPANGWVQANGSLGASEDWQINGTWGTKTITGLTSDTEYCFQVKARNGDGTATALSTTACATTSNIAPTMASISLNQNYAKSGDTITVTGATVADSESANLNFYCATTTNPSSGNTDFCSSTGIASPYSNVSCNGSGASGDGVATIYCKVYDGALYSTTERTDTYTKDNTAPTTGTISEAATGGVTNYTNDPTPALTISGVSDSGSGMNQMSFSCNNSTWSSWVSYATSYSSFNIRTGAGCTDAEGSKTVYVKFNDVVGNASSSINTGAFTLDQTAPTSNTLSLHASAWTGGVTNFTNDDTPQLTIGSTGAYKMAFRCDSGSWTSEENFATSKTNFDVNSGNNGCTAVDEVKTVTVYLKDEAGNNTTKTATAFTFDTVAPTHTTPRTPANTPYRYSSPDPNLIPTYTEANGVAKCFARISTNATISNANTIRFVQDASPGNTCTFSGYSALSEGTYYWDVNAMDKAGNWSSYSAAWSFVRDNTAPTVPTTFTIENDSTAPYWDNVNNSDTNLSFTALESGETCKWNATSVAYGSMGNSCGVSGTDVNCAFGNLSQTTTGSQYLSRYHACIDDVGNDYTQQQIDFGVDWSAPTTSDDFNAAIQIPTYTVTLTEADNASEASDLTTYWCVDQSDSCTPNESADLAVSFTTDAGVRGTNYLRYYSKDLALNTQSTVSRTININQLPSFGAASDDATTVKGGTDTVTITTTASVVDAGQTIKLVVCKTIGVTGSVCDGGEGDTYCSTALGGSNPTCNWTSESDNTSHDWYAYIFDSVHEGASANYKTGSYTTDSANPVMTNSTPSNASGTSDTTPTLVATANETIASCTLQIDNDSGFGSPITLSDSGVGTVSGGTTCTYTVPGADALSDGTYYWRMKGTDTVGNAGSYGSYFSIVIDTTALSTTLTSIAGDSGSPYWDTANDSQTAVIVAGESGMSCRYGASDAVYGSMSDNCSISGSNATCNLGAISQASGIARYISCKDSVGNEQTTGQNIDLSFGVDWTAPTINGGTPTTEVTSLTSTTYAKSPVDIQSGSGTITDNVSLDTSSCEYTLNNGGAWVGGTWSGASTKCVDTGVTLNAGSNVINYRISDAAGNTTTGTSVTYTKDNDGPTTPTLGFATITITSIQITGSGSTDAGSGLHATAPYYFDRTAPTADNSGYIASPWTNNALSVNTQYTYRVKAKDKLGNEGSYTGTTAKYTYANIPSAPTVNQINGSSATVIVNVNSNPAATQFAIFEQNSNSGSGYYVAANNVLNSATAIWQTKTQWGGAGGTAVTSVPTSYSFKVKARNGDNVETVFGPATAGTLNTAPEMTGITLDQSVAASGTTINVTAQGVADSQSDTLTFYCSDTVQDTGANIATASDFCTQATIGSGAYGSVGCAGTGLSTNGTVTVACVLYDGTVYSGISTQGYTNENSMPFTSSDINSSWQSIDANVHFTCYTGGGNYNFVDIVSENNWNNTGNNSVITSVSKTASLQVVSSVTDNGFIFNGVVVLQSGQTTGTVTVTADATEEVQWVHYGMGARKFPFEGKEIDVRYRSSTDGTFDTEEWGSYSPQYDSPIPDVSTRYIQFQIRFTDSSTTENSFNTMLLDDFFIDYMATGGGACGATYYRLDSDATSTVSLGSLQTFDQNLLISADGNHAVEFYSVSLAGNTENPPQTKYVLIEKNIEAPTLDACPDISDSTQIQLDWSGGSSNAGINYYEIMVSMDGVNYFSLNEQGNAADTYFDSTYTDYTFDIGTMYTDYGFTGICGDGFCTSGEVCPEDSFDCPWGSSCTNGCEVKTFVQTNCGDSVCDAGENCVTDDSVCIARYGAGYLCINGCVDSTAGSYSGTVTADASECGNGICNFGEDESNCAADCSSGNMDTSDGFCDWFEPAGTDCVCVTNGTCEYNENPQSCSSDCQNFYEGSGGGGGDFCNFNGYCDASFGETTANCPQDCGFNGTCNDNGVCDSGETEANCGPPVGKSDCLGISCPNASCSVNESSESCPADCGASFGQCNNNGTCDADENNDSCPNDCGQCGDGFCATGEFCFYDNQGCRNSATSGNSNFGDNYVCGNPETGLGGCQQIEDVQINYECGDGTCSPGENCPMIIENQFCKQKFGTSFVCVNGCVDAPSQSFLTGDSKFDPHYGSNDGSYFYKLKTYDSLGNSVESEPIECFVDAESPFQIPNDGRSLSKDLNAAWGTFDMSFPSGVFGFDNNVIIDTNNTPPAFAHGNMFQAYNFEVPQGATEFGAAKPRLTLDINVLVLNCYDSGQSAPLYGCTATELNKVSIYDYNETSGEWQRLPSTVDVDALTVYADLNHFSLYGQGEDTDSPTVTLVSPTNAVSDTDVDPDFQGTPSETVTNCYLQVDDASDFSSPFSDLSGVDIGTDCDYAGSEYSTDFAAGTTVYWRMKATDEAENEGSYSSSFSYSVPSSGGGGGGPVCGNGSCESGETQATCPADCGVAAVCGDGTCNGSETAETCPADCYVAPYCGDNTCDPGENKNNCAADCEAVCGNAVCEPGETKKKCPTDCAPDTPGVCTGGEVRDCQTCGTETCTSGEIWGSCNEPAFCDGTDLTISAITADAQVEYGTSATVSMNVLNLGEGTATAFNVRLSQDGGTYSDEKTVVGIGDNPDAVGILFNVPWNPANAGASVTYIVEVDSSSDPNLDNSIDEPAAAPLGEYNNSSSISVTFGEPEICNNLIDDNFDGYVDEECGLPNLKITNVEVGEPEFVGDELIRVDFNVTIEAEFEDVTTEFIVSYFKDVLDVDGRITLELVDSIAVGESVKLMFVYTAPIGEVIRFADDESVETALFAEAMFADLTNFYVEVDSGNAIEEVDETDNVVVINIQNLLSDLTFKELLEGDIPAISFIGETVTVSVSIVNHGDASVASDSYSVSIYVDDVIVDLQTQLGPALASGEEAAVSFTLTGLEEGDHIIKLKVDSLGDSVTGELAEANEENNEVEAPHTVLGSLDEIYTYPIFMDREPVMAGVWNPIDIPYEFTYNIPRISVTESVMTFLNLNPVASFELTFLDGSFSPDTYNLKVNRDGPKIYDEDFTVIESTHSNVISMVNDRTIDWVLHARFLKLMHYERMNQLLYVWWQLYGES